MSRVERDPERGRAAAAKLKALGVKGILIGDGFVREAVLDAAIDDYACARFEIERPMLGRADAQGHGHWCLPPDGSSYCTDAREM